MKSIFILNAVTMLAKAGLWFSFGYLVKNHLDSFWTFVTRKPLPENSIETAQLQNIYKVTHWIGICLMVIGAGLALSALAILMFGGSVPGVNIKF